MHSVNHEQTPPYKNVHYANARYWNLDGKEDSEERKNFAIYKGLHISNQIGECIRGVCGLWCGGIW